MVKKQVKTKGFAKKTPVVEKDITTLVNQLHDLTTQSVLPLVEELRLAHYRKTLKLTKALLNCQLSGLNDFQKASFYAVETTIESAVEDLEHFMDDPQEIDSIYKSYAAILADMCCALRAGIGYWRDKTGW